MSESSTERVLYGASKQYALPPSLEDRDGPASGVIELPLAVYWGPDPVVDLGTDSGAEKAYQALIQEGHVRDLVALIDSTRLRTVWAELLIPRRARAEWETRFPELVT
ncbi:transcriptional regulator [Rathayibacter sp. VKM Ac-2857]|uniref:transcriptional regulator n=1 Tax=Rathayibacter sp. VKM Ac-2857 TaxID=2739020 RepID=UPI0015636AA7|nr:transcriptional regulator [Rathayibacter sp. VKM Ac-2857]NQX15025.1 transcriptional regulator [Rathayibacter sp. VKM Ac-2857]